MPGPCGGRLLDHRLELIGHHALEAAANVLDALGLTPPDQRLLRCREGLLEDDGEKVSVRVDLRLGGSAAVVLAVQPHELRGDRRACLAVDAHRGSEYPDVRARLSESALRARGLVAPEYDRRVIATSEYELVTESAGLVERPGRAMFVVRGAGAVEFLQGQVSNDVESLAPGEGCYATILNHKGKLRTDLRVLRGADFFWLDTEPIGHAVVRHMLVTYSLGRDVQWEDVGGDHALLSLIGPAADDVIDRPPPAAEHSFVDTGRGLNVRTDLGVDLLCSTARAQELRADLRVEEVSEEVAECLRIESGRPRLGLDMDAETIPQEAGINDRAVNFEKGCYVGQETVARLHYKGKPNRHLRGLLLSEPAERRAEVMLGDKPVGRVGSTCISPRLGPIALALVRREAAPGDTVTVNGAEAQVAELPFERG